VNGSTGSAMSWNLYSYVQGNPMNLTDPLGLHKKDLGSGTWDATIPYQKPIKKEECEAQGCNWNDKNKACYCTDENGNEVKVNTVEEAQELNRRVQQKAWQLYKYLWFQGYTGSFEEFLFIFKNQFLPMLSAYNEWFKNPQLGLGQKYCGWGPLGNLLYSISFGNWCSSCVGMAIGLLSALQNLNTANLQTIENVTKGGFHTNVQIQIKDPKYGNWIPMTTFDPYWRLW
jgi:hypothetical protein